MSLYAIGDLHLSLSSDKPMDIFGGKWENYMNKIALGFADLSQSDTTVLCGDTTWGMNMEEALEDFRFIDALPGRKIVLKGNHDYWWSTAAKMNKFFEANDINSIEILHNNCFFYGEAAICGTRGWFYEEETHGAHDRKILNRELQRLERSLKAAGDTDKLCFLHYPPRFRDYICHEITELLERYGVSACFYGHIHAKGHRFAIQGEIEGIYYRMVSADYLDFKPVKIL